MRSIVKFLLTIIVFLVSISIVGGTICLFLNKANLLNINDYIVNKPIVKYFVSEETYQDTIKSKYEDYENQLKEKDEIITQHELTIQQLQTNLDSITKDYNSLEKEIEDIKKSEEVNIDEANIISYYNNMKEKKVAEILSNMKSTEVVNIIVRMDSEKVSKILENMEAKKAAEITLLLNKLNPLPPTSETR